MKKVVTLDSVAFAAACAGLEGVVSDLYDPDYVVGIESGGRYVAEHMFAALPHGYVARQRPSTRRKGKAVRNMLRFMPRFVADNLRRGEAWLLSRKTPVALTYEGPLPAGLMNAERVLVVDDAVDSGATLYAVISGILAVRPNIEIRTAAIVQTTDSPLIRPDFVLFSNCLMRFPWSADMN